MDDLIIPAGMESFRLPATVTPSEGVALLNRIRLAEKYLDFITKTMKAELVKVIPEGEIQDGVLHKVTTRHNTAWAKVVDALRGELTEAQRAALASLEKTFQSETQVHSFDIIGAPDA
jgi:hypothetical protein